MVEESALPDRLARSRTFERARKDPLKSPNPIAEFNVIWQRHEKVQVVRENHIAPNRNAEIVLRVFAESHECFMNTIIRKIRPTSIGAAGYEIEWIAWENNVESSRSSRELCHNSV